MGIEFSKYLEMEARCSRNRKKADFVSVCAGEPVGKESTLDAQVERHCIAEGYLYVRSRTDMKPTIASGHPDYTIFLPNARTVFLELKSRTGKATIAQLTKLAHARKLGFVAEIVDCFEGAFAAIRKARS